MPTPNEHSEHGESDRARTDEATARAEHLEAVARVTATVAHDFGNVLMAISLFQGFIVEGLGPGHALAADVAAIGEAVERGRTSHAQLVAVGRDSPDDWQGRVDVLDVLDRLHGILQAIAAPATLRLEADPGEGGSAGMGVGGVVGGVPRGVPRVQMGQRALEHAVLGLVVNARDSMTSRAGVITVTVGAEFVPGGLVPGGLGGSDPAPDLALPPGRYVTVTVADDASEPLSTAKEPGTGLGLSSVLRTARRAGGAVRIDSAPGVGTTVTLLLPEAPTA